MEGPQIRENGRAKEDSPKILARAHMSMSQRNDDPGEFYLGTTNTKVRPNLA